MIYRRLPVAFGTIAFPAPEEPPEPEGPPIVDLTNAPEGGGSRWSVPQAIYANGTTFVAYVRGTDGREQILEYDHGTQTATVNALHGNFDRDDHSNPAIIRRDSDGRIVVFYSKHNFTPFNVRVTTNPEDTSSWQTQVNLDSQLGGTRYTYPQVHQLLAETGDPFHLFYRDEPSPGTDSRWCHSTCAPASVTSGWAAQSILYRVASRRSYMTSWSDGQDRIHFIVTDGGGTIVDSGFTALGHFYYDAGSYFKSDGTPMSSPPFEFDDVTQIMGGSRNLFPAHLYLDGSGHPVLAAFNEDEDDIWHYWYMRWSGSAWVTTEVATGDTGHAYSSATSRSPYGCCLDDGDVDVMYAIIEQDNIPEVWRFETADGGATFDAGTAITEESTAAVQREPFPVRNRDSSLALVWQYGTFTSYVNYSMGIKGVEAT